MTKFTPRLLLIALLTSAAPVHAALPPTPDRADSAPQAAPAEQTPAASDDGLADIIVTASRREESVQKTALPISTLSGDTLARSGVTQPETLSGAVAGLNITPNGAVSQVFLRGVGTFAIAGYTDSAVAFNLDGVFLSFPAQINGAFYDVSRIEVLKGPQGTLYGRNASAGAINVITNRPVFDLGGSANLEIGNYDLRKVDAMVNLPLSDKIAFRIAGQVIRRDGYYRDGLGNDRSESIRARLLLEPTETLSVLIGADYTHTGGTGTPSVARTNTPSSSDPFEGPTTATGNQALTDVNATLPGFAQLPLNTVDANSIDVDSRGVHAEVNLDLGLGTLTFLPSYRKLTDKSRRFPGFAIANDDEGDQTSAELRLASNPGGALKWIVGGYFFDSNYTNRLSIEQGTNSADGVALQDSTTYAGFGEATYSLTERFRLTGGLRYTTEHKQQEGVYNSTSNLPPTPTVTYDLAGEETYNNLSFKAGAEYDVGARSLAYATVSRGFKAGGFNLDSAPNSFEPETLTAYTLGLKNRFFDNRLQANFEAFYWDYKNHQEIFLQALNAGGFSPQNVNIAKSTLYGLNAELEFLATPNDLFSAQLEYLHSRLDDFTYSLPTTLAPVEGVSTGCRVTSPSAGVSSVDCSGKPFTRAPKWTANLGYQHIFDLGARGKIVAGVDSQLKSSQELSIDYAAGSRQGGYTLTNLNLSYTTGSGRFTIAGFVRNLEDRVIYTSAFQRPRVGGLFFETLRAPRTYGGSIGVKF